MPKTPNSLTPNKNKYFIYEKQSPKKTHCNKTINNCNHYQTPEFLPNRPTDHWTENKNNSNWDYYKLLSTQAALALDAFQKTQEWKYWEKFQKDSHLLRNLVHNSVNLTYFTLQEAKSLNEITEKEIQRGKEANRK
jgi:hypothetical protein